MAALLLCVGVLGTPAYGAGTTLLARSAAAGCPGANLAPNGYNSAAVDSATLCLTNQLRVARGMHPLRLNRALAAVASGQASDMVRGDYFGDQSLSGQTPLSRIMRTGYPLHATAPLMTAQNIGWGTGPNATPAGIVRAWMLSPPHRAIMLTRGYRDVGVGVAAAVPSALGAGWPGGTYAVEFAARRR
jgi:uncharacterized protein YkwD